MAVLIRRRQNSTQTRVAALGKGSSAVAPQAWKGWLGKSSEVDLQSDEPSYGIRRGVMTKVPYGKLTASLISAWFISCVLASGFEIFSRNPSRPPILLG